MRFRRFLPQGISLYLTYRCQSRCPHCFLVENGKIGRYELSLEHCLSIIDEASEQRVFLLVLSGGEPLLHSCFSQIIHYARQKGMLPLLGLTGVGVSDEHIHQIAACGIPTVQVSLDGATEAANDRIRGPGNFAEVSDTVARFKRAGIKVNLAICLHQQNLNEAEALYTLAREWGIARVKLTFYESTEKARVMVEIPFQKKQEILQSARDFMSRYRLSTDWIACPTHDVNTGRLMKGENRSPPLVIGADGELTVGEWGERIGSLSCGTLTGQYSEFVHHKKQVFFERTIALFARQFGVSNISFVDKNLGANALVYEQEGKRNIVVDRKLPASLSFFTVLHELGHVATDTLMSSPRDSYSPQIELSANLWVLEILGKHIDREALPSYISAAYRSEAALYHLVDECLDKDLINYWH